MKLDLQNGLKGARLPDSTSSKLIALPEDVQQQCPLPEHNQLMGREVCELNNHSREANPEDLVHDIDKLYMKRFVNRDKNIV